MKLSEFISKYGDCEVTEEMEKFIEKPKGKWMPRYGEEYYYVGDNGYIYDDKWAGHDNDVYRRYFSRIFKTQEEASRHREIMRACKEASFEPDWEDHDQSKYHFYYNYGNSNKKLCINPLTFSNSGEPFYFESYDIARDLIERFGEKDIAKYVLGVEV